VSSVSEDHDKSTSLRILLLVVVTLLIFSIYLFLWLPILSTISKEIVRVRSMILMIPISICSKTKAIKDLLRDYLSNSYKDGAN